jgi:hypothetical protein
VSGTKKLLRWYMAGLVFLLVVSPAIAYGVYRYVMSHPAEPGTLAGRVYEKTVKTKLSFFCAKTMKQHVKPEGTNTEAQSEIACKCFVDDMFEKFRYVPPGDLNAMADAHETQRDARLIFNKCVNQSGMN